MKKTLLLVPMLIAAACQRAPDADPRMISEIMHTMYGVLKVERLSPPVASRLMTYANSALYSGFATTDRTLRPLAGVLNGFPELPTVSGDVAVDGPLVGLAANRMVLDTLLRDALPTTRAALSRLADSLDASRVAQGIDSAIAAESRALGQQIASQILAWSRVDGFAETRGRTYAAPVGPQYWVNDAPAQIYAQQNLSGASEFVALDNPANVLQAGKTSDRALVLNRPKAGGPTLPAVNMTGTSEPYWGEVRPFALGRWDECTIPEPPAYSTDTTSELYRNAYEVYRAKMALTPEHKTTALYWADNSGESGTPVGHWLAIASQMVSQRQLSAGEAVRVALLTSIAEADAFVAAWGYKYKWNLIRPRTYIRRVIDSAWEPQIPTPPFPEYPSGHSTMSTAAASVITAVLGTMPFDDSTSMLIGHDVRRFESFEEAARQAGMSRIYGGIHYPIGNTAGQTLGKCIGERVMQRYQGQ